LEGRFTTRWAAFMAMRRAVRAIPVQHADPARGERSRATSAPAVPWRDAPVVWFLAQLRLPRSVSFGYDLDPATLRPVASRLSAPDGSWARIKHDGGQVTEAGPTPIWSGIEWACEQWIAAGRPAWSQLALTVTSDGGHQIWVDEPTGTYRWGI
jgi:hypothetical protein